MTRMGDQKAPKRAMVAPTRVAITAAALQPFW